MTENTNSVYGSFYVNLADIQGIPYWNQPRSITLSDLVTISPHTKTVTYHKDYTPDAAAKVFWECLCRPSYDVIKEIYAKEIEQHFLELSAKRAVDTPI